MPLFVGITRELIRNSTTWETMKSHATSAWDEIVKSLQSGNIQRAMKITTASLKMMWIELINSLQNKWNDFHGSVSEIATSTFAALGINDESDVAKSIRSHERRRRELRHELIEAHQEYENALNQPIDSPSAKGATRKGAKGFGEANLRRRV